MMKQFTKLYSDFWINFNNSEIMDLRVDVQLMAVYLQGNSHHNILGAYYLPILYIASDLRLPVERVQIALKKLCQINYCKYDEKTQHIWICNLAFEQIGKNISNKDNRIKAIHAIWDSLPSQLAFLEEIHQKYGAAFHFKPRAFEEPSKIRKTERSEQKLGSEVAVKDVSSNINTNDIDINVNSGINTATEAQHCVKSSPSSNSATSTTPFELSSEAFSLFLENSESFENSYQDINIDKDSNVFENNYKNDSSDTLPEPPATFLEAPLGTKIPSTKNYIVPRASLEGELVEKDGKSSNAFPPSKSLRSPFEGGYEDPSKPLASPFEGASDPLRSNIEYRNRIKKKNIEDRSKKEEVEKEEKRKDLYENNVPIPNIVAFKQQTRPCVDGNADRNENVDKNSIEIVSCESPCDLISEQNGSDVVAVVSDLDSGLGSGSDSDPKSGLRSKPNPNTKSKAERKPRSKTKKRNTKLELKSVSEKNRECNEEKNVDSANVCTTNKSSDGVTTVFEHWKNVMQHPRSKLDRKRKGLIRRALQDGYSTQQLCDAITGCSLTGHNIGENDRGQRYDGLHVILGDADQIDRFIYNCHHPPRPFSKAHQRLHANLGVASDWVQNKISKLNNEQKLN